MALTLLMMKISAPKAIFGLVILLFAVACTTLPPNSIYEAQPTWFSLRKSISLSSGDGIVQPHLFYDSVANLDLTGGHVNFIPLALANSDRAYAIDPLSGQRFFSHFWCRQTDAWNQRGSTPRRPTFTRGVVPRQFDQLHEPQQIIVFGESKHYKLNTPTAYNVRVVGGVVEQICKSGRCSGPGQWLARLVLVAVNEHDSSFKDVKTIRDLREEVSWPNVQNELENHEGHNFTPGFGKTPAVKVGNLLENKEVLDYMTQRSVILTAKELTDINRQCGKLYSRLWRDVGRFTALDAKLADKDLRKQLEMRDKLRKDGKASTFHELLTEFLKREGDALATCSRMVYPGNPGGNHERFWFVSWISMYARLHRDGWEYSCATRSWKPENVGATAAMNFLQNDSGSCGDNAFDAAIESMPSFLENQRRTAGDHWAFLEWDNGVYGTHKKLFSWVKVPARIMSCSSDSNEVLRKKWPTRPEGHTWTRRYQKANRNKKDTVIY